MKWAVGVTTVPERRSSGLTDRTLASIKAAGWEQEPWLFVDGKGVRIRCAGNWLLGLAELHARMPDADLYVMFQDDIVCTKNLRQYLEATLVPQFSTLVTQERPTSYSHACVVTTTSFQRCYFNLITYSSNEAVIAGQSKGWMESGIIGGPDHGDPRRWQTGRGAQGLVFTPEGILTLLSSRSLWRRFRDPNKGHRNVDGAICNAMNEAGWREMIHNPSLIEHVGQSSTIQPDHDNAPPSKTFPGQDFDILRLLDAR